MAGDAATQAAAIERAVTESARRATVRAAGKAPPSSRMLRPTARRPSEAAGRSAAAPRRRPTGRGIIAKLATLGSSSTPTRRRGPSREGFDASATSARSRPRAAGRPSRSSSARATRSSRSSRPGGRSRRGGRGLHQDGQQGRVQRGPHRHGAGHERRRHLHVRPRRGAERRAHQGVHRAAHERHARPAGVPARRRRGGQPLAHAPAGHREGPLRGDARPILVESTATRSSSSSPAAGTTRARQATCPHGAARGRRRGGRDRRDQQGLEADGPGTLSALERELDGWASSSPSSRPTARRDRPPRADREDRPRPGRAAGQQPEHVHRRRQHQDARHPPRHRPA